MSWVWIQLRKVFQGQSANWNFRVSLSLEKGRPFQKEISSSNHWFSGDIFFSKEIYNEIWNDPSYSAKKALSPFLVQPKKTHDWKVSLLPLLVKAEWSILDNKRVDVIDPFKKTWADIPSSLVATDLRCQPQKK